MTSLFWTIFSGRLCARRRIGGKALLTVLGNRVSTAPGYLDHYGPVAERRRAGLQNR